MSMAHATRSLDDAVGSLARLPGRPRPTTRSSSTSRTTGFLYGEHRRFGKNDPWEESVNVPDGGQVPGRASDRSAVRQRRARAERGSRGHDRRPRRVLLGGPTGDRSFPSCSGRRERSGSRSDRALPRGAHEGRRLLAASRSTAASRYARIRGDRDRRYKYVEFDDGSRQLIDLKTDPRELRNLASGRNVRASLERSLAARLDRMMGSHLQTTIATGPGPTLQNRIAAFTYFSPSRFATYRCRLVRDGTPDPWHPCPGQFAAIGDLADGKYAFQVAGII